MRTRKFSLKQFSAVQLDQVLPRLQAVLEKQEAEFYFLGGLARDMLLLSEGKKALRMTRDIDVAVFTPDPDTFFAIKAELIQEEGFRPVPTNPLRVYHVTDAIVDLLPFNRQTSRPDATDEFGPDLAGFSFQGLLEVYLAGTQEFFLEETPVRVTRPAGILLLKFLAYVSKPELRIKDMEDIGQLLRIYFDLEEEEIYHHHNDLFGQERPLTAIAARVAGRQMALIVRQNPGLKSKVMQILQQFLQEGLRSRAVLILAKELEVPLEVAWRYVNEVVSGLEDQE